MNVGYVFAVLAALASGSGSILESIGVRRAGAFGGTSMDLVGLRRQWIYFAGLGADLTGFVCAAAALRQLPLFLVQSVLAFSVGVTATIATFLGTRLSPAGWLTLGVGATGLVLLGLSAEPSPAAAIESGWRWLLVGMAIPVATIAWRAKRRTGPWAASALAFSTGLGFSIVGVSARTLQLPDSAWRLILEPSAWAIAVNGVVAAVVFAMALQKGRPTGVTAIMFTTNTSLASLIGLIYLDDRVRAGFDVAAATGFVCAVAGAIGVAHFAAIARQRSGAW
ncbi:MAG: hypothetical protein GEU86_14445 [Actinophytocola sp.]|nr:hypothetical protein [Actinophytocola sp.]